MNRPVPVEHFWMTRYFRGAIGYEFVRYFLTFRCDVHFPLHVGRPCNKRWVKRMKSRFLALEREHARSKSEMDFERLADIEMGKFKLN